MLLTSVMLYLFDPFAVGFLSLYIMYDSQNVSCYIVVATGSLARAIEKRCARFSRDPTSTCVLSEVQ